MSDSGVKIVVCMWLVMMFVFGTIAGREWGATAEQQKAFKAGAGRWVANPETGDMRFEYGVPQGE